MLLAILLLLLKTLHPLKLGALVPVVAPFVAVVALDVTVFTVCRLHGYATAYGRLRVSGGAGQVVDVHVTHSRPDAVEVERAVAVTVVSNVLVVGRDGVYDDVLVTVVGDLFLHFLQTVLPVVHLVKKKLRIFPRRHLARGQFLVETRRSSFAAALYLASRAFHAPRPLPNPSPVLPSYCLTVVRADPAVLQKSTLKSSSSARSNTEIFPVVVFSLSGCGRLWARQRPS